MTILEDVSYTRKDGQYLRWDYRSGRALRTRVDKGPVLSFQHALGARLFEMVQGRRHTQAGVRRRISRAHDGLEFGVVARAD